MTVVTPSVPKDRMPVLSSKDLKLIHDASLRILKTTGINFNDDTATALFSKNGFRTDGSIVFFTEAQVEKALSTTLSDFSLHARNPQKSIHVGGKDMVLLPTGGAPNVAGIDGSQRPATLSDFKIACKLVQTSGQLDMGGFVMVQPTDIPQKTAHLDMMLNYMTLCDKPIFGASGSGRMAKDTIDMAGLLFGGKERLKTKPVMASIINVMSPLQYSQEQTQALAAMASCNQPVVITNMILAGGTGPVSIPSLLALANAEVLAGIVFSQLISPGAPVIYGSTSAPMDMKTMVSAVGALETIQIASATIQLAEHYNLPCRTGGGLTDAHIPDGQALSESTVMLNTVIRNGAHFIYHSCGQMGSFISMSFEKWIIDEQICATIRGLMTPLDISPDTIDVETIREVGIGGQYLSHPTTFDQFRNLSQSDLFNRKDHSRWSSEGALSVAQSASEKIEQRLSQYEKPFIDPEIETALNAFVRQRKAG